MPWYRKISWFTVAGSTLIFFSWVAQNYFLNHWSDKAQEIIEIEGKLERQRGMMELWDAWLHVSRGKKDQKMEAYAKSMWIIHGAVIRTIVEASVVYDDPQYIMKLREEEKVTRKNAISYYLDENYEMLDEEYRKLGRRIEERRAALEQKYLERFAKVVAMKEDWNLRFVGLYIVGSLLIGIAYFRSKLTMEARDPDR